MKSFAVKEMWKFSLLQLNEMLRKQLYFDKDSAGMEDGEGRLRKEISET